MSTFTVLLLCIQACFIQNVFTQCIGNYGAELVGLGLGYGAGLASPAAYGCGTRLAGPAAIVTSSYNYDSGYPGPVYGYPENAYGGAGEGNVGVAGELPVAGNTAVAGQVPIMGAVGFNGAIPAGGAVSIAGNCACGCNGPYQYQY